MDSRRQVGARIRGFASRAAVVLLFAAMLLAARTAEAFCGFYVSGAGAKLFANASQVVMMREGTRTVLSMQNDYQGPPESFAMVVPVPVVLQKENVKTLPKEIFARIDKLDAPRLVEYWERDPCEPEPLSHRRTLLGGARPPAPAPAGAAAGKDLGVTIEAQFTVGEYEIVILGAKDSAGLDAWLKREGYKIPQGSEPFLRPYVQQGSKFFVAKVDASKVKMESGKVTLSPLRFHYDASTFTLPIRLGLVNSSGTQDLIVHVLGKGKRYEVANYPNVTIPTNLDVAENAKERFGTFYASLFDKTLEKTPRAVVTEYAWDAGSCDPCPEPPLTDGELVTLGADVLPSVLSEADLVDPALLKALGTDAGPKGRTPPSPRRRYYGVSSSFVLTRLHARYTREALGDDLTFKEATAIGGGRELIGTNGTLESGSQSSGSNNFQGRYAVRHPWSGPIECESPVRNRWGGPPNGLTNGPAKPALGLAYASRDNVQFASFLRTDVSELGVKAAGEVPSPVGTFTKPASPAPDRTSAVVADADGGASGAAPAKSGCGACTTGASSSSSGPRAAFGFAMAIGIAVLRRGRRASRGVIAGLALALVLLGARRADAFCGFYVSGADAKLFNNATQVVIMREGTRTVLSMQNNYQGPPEKFAMVVPVPVVLQKENVKTLPAKIFAKVDELTAPRLVEYWEQDPCPKGIGDLKVGSGGPVQGGGKGAGLAALASSPASVTVEAQFTVGEYEIVILSAKDSGGLDAWLKQEGYKIPDGAEPYLRPYVQAGSKFFVARVDVTKVVMKDGNAELSPLRFHYDTSEFTLPMRLGLINSKGTQDLIVNVLASTRTEPANYPSVTIPTNIDIAEGSREHFGRFYASLFDKTLAKTPRAVVTEYAWDARTCDPCPGPTLDSNDFATLGSDVLSGSRPAPRVSPRVEATKEPSARNTISRSAVRVRACQGARFAKNVRPEGTLKLEVAWDGKGKVKKVKVVEDDMNDAETTKCVKGVLDSLTFAERGEDGSAIVTYAFSIGREDTMRDWTITRMHARYTRDALGADIVFRSAGGIVGGRESTNAQGEIEHGAKPDSVNNFQARYVIRHPWTGPIECKEPVRNKWGGPPGGVAPGTSAVKRTAFVPRGGIELASFVRSDVPELGLKAGKGPLTGVPPLSSAELALLEPPPLPEAGPAADAAPVADAGAGAGAGAGADADAGAEAPKKSGCAGCAMSTGPRISWPIGALVLALALAARRRSRSS